MEGENVGVDGRRNVWSWILSDCVGEERCERDY